MIPARAESRIIHAKGEKKSGTMCNSTEPAWAIACKVVIRNTPHSIRAEIHVAGEAKKEARYGPATHIKIANPPVMNRIEPQNLRRRSAIFRAARRVSKRDVNPAAGDTFFTELKAFPVSRSAEQ